MQEVPLSSLLYRSGFRGAWRQGRI